MNPRFKAPAAAESLTPKREQPSVSLGPSDEGGAALGVAGISLAVLALGLVLGFGARAVAVRESS